MCEIYFIYNDSEPVKTSNLVNLLYTAVQEGSRRNSDGFGLFNEDREIYKSEDRLTFEDLGEIVEKYYGSKFVVLHLRMATQGAVCFENSHPFKHRDNLLVHNGSVTPENHFKKGRADSYQLLRDIYKRKDGDTVKAVQDSLNNTTGSVSVFLYDYKDDLYYFREGSRFQFARLKDTGELVGATVGQRLTSAFEIENLQFQTPEEEKLYKIEGDVEKIDRFTMDTQFVTTGSDSVYSSYGWGAYEEDEDEYDDELIRESDYQKYKEKMTRRHPHF
jgi:predicted glutamine amidotransferase